MPRPLKTKNCVAIGAAILAGAFGLVTWPAALLAVHAVFVHHLTCYIRSLEADLDRLNNKIWNTDATIARAHQMLLDPSYLALERANVRTTAPDYWSTHDASAGTDKHE